MKHIVKIDDVEYVGKIKKHTNQSWICKLYKKTSWGIPIKVYEKVYLRCYINEDSFDMCWNTAFEYEKTNIK